MGFVNKIGGLAIVCAAIGAVALAWTNHTTAPEISLLVLSCLCVLAVAGVMVALALVAKTRQETAKLSRLFEDAVDRMERRHDSDHARLVMTLAALETRNTNRTATDDVIKYDRAINEIRPPVSASPVKNAMSPDDRIVGKEPVSGDKLYSKRQIASALSGKNIELSLEPIFEMPTAEVRGYIAFAHIEGGVIRRLAASTDPDSAEFEYQLLFASAKAIRQVMANVPDQTKLFCSISVASLHEAKWLDAIMALYSAQPILKDRLVLLIASEGLQDESSAALDGLERAGIHLAIEGMPERLDFLRKCKGGHWFINAAEIIALPAAEFRQKYRYNVDTLELSLVALEGGNDSQLIELLDINVTLATSKHLSPPRLVRTS